MRLQFIPRRYRRILIGILLPAMILRAAIPAGYMPAMGADGRPALVMCSGRVLAQPGVTTSATHDSTAPDTAAPGQLHAPCLFAASAAPAPPPAIFAAPGRVLARDASHSAGVYEFPKPTIIRAQSARAPPPPRDA